MMPYRCEISSFQAVSPGWSICQDGPSLDHCGEMGGEQPQTMTMTTTTTTSTFTATTTAEVGVHSLTTSAKRSPLEAVKRNWNALSG
ncbi:unnamed protein product [Nippostrongylus brasiliensis]|uniref:Uncharacterized protein n=1 Tax=Nippostrongylus brasiliensis TaxID=27835 RepID=A0A0N4Y9Q1_NIPBR|nr:unnamed protein product [Nippostrongylus brasiliensis]